MEDTKSTPPINSNLCLRRFGPYATTPHLDLRPHLIFGLFCGRTNLDYYYRRYGSLMSSVVFVVGGVDFYTRGAALRYLLRSRMEAESIDGVSVGTPWALRVPAMSSSCISLTLTWLTLLAFTFWVTSCN